MPKQFVPAGKAGSKSPATPPTCPKRKRFERNLTKYGLAAGATVAGLGLAPSEAGLVVYPGTPAPPPPGAGGSGLVGFNVLGTGGPPAGATTVGTAPGVTGVLALGSIAPSFQFGVENENFGTKAGANAIAASTAMVPGFGLPALYVPAGAPIGTGVTITSGMPFKPGGTAILLASVFGGGPFFTGGPGPVTGFIGLAFDIDGPGGTPPNLGWANISVAGGGSPTPFAVTLNSFAIETVPGVGALTPGGAVPEASEALLLAAGASGLALFRRRKKKVAAA